jgi:hypothetical protein
MCSGPRQFVIVEEGIDHFVVEGCASFDLYIQVPEPAARCRTVGRFKSLIISAIL